LVGKAKDIIKGHSPSKVFADIGESIVQGLALGLAGANKLSVPMPQLAGTSLKPGGELIMSGLQAGLEAGWAKIQPLLASVADGIAAAVAPPQQAALNLGTSVSNAVPAHGPTAGINPGSGNQEPFPIDAQGRPTGDFVSAAMAARFGMPGWHQGQPFPATYTGVRGFALGTVRVPDDMLAFIHRGEMIIPPGIAEQMRSGGNQAGTAPGGLGIAVNGPLTIVNNNRQQDVNSALGDLAFGVAGQLRRRGVYQ